MGVRSAASEDLPERSRLFDADRVFDHQASDPGAAERCLRERFARRDSPLVLAARDADGLAGFTQPRSRRRIARARGLVYPAPVPNARAGLLVPLALACAAPPPLPPGVSAKPALGEGLDGLLAKLQHAEQPGPRVVVEELRVLAVDREPWTRLEPAPAAKARGRVAVVAGRRCSRREGLRTARAERSSWFLLAEGALVAFDHDGFSAACASLPAFQPASRSDVAIERQLVRYVTQRWPDDAVPAQERLARGLALLSRGREDDALAELHALDQRIAELERRAEDPEAGDAAEREAWSEQAHQLQPQRTQLQGALRDFREEGELR